MREELPAELDFSKLTPVIGRGIFAAEARGAAPMKARYAVVDEESIAVSLEDGRRVIAPIAWYPRLKHATPAERNNWRLLMGGRAVGWRSLGLAIAVKALLEGTKASESAASLRKWLDERTSKQRRKTA
jgi:ABC-type branched-subunit amino acid transport system substrate-binding protein